MSEHPKKVGPHELKRYAGDLQHIANAPDTARERAAQLHETALLMRTEAEKYEHKNETN